MKTQEYQHPTKSNLKVIQQDFNSINDLYTYITSPTLRYNSVFSDSYDRSSDNGDYSFSRTSSFDEALNLLTHGYTEASKRLTEKLKLSSQLSISLSSKPTYSTVGYQASVPRYLQNIPTSMINTARTQKQQKIITLIKDCTYSSFISTREIEDEGIKALQIIQALEGQGFRVKLVALIAAQKGKEVYITRTVIKAPEERLSIAKIAFPVVHPSFLRRIYFRLLETAPITESQFRYGYGKPCGQETYHTDTLPKGEHLLPNFIADPQQYISSLNLK